MQISKPKIYRQWMGFDPPEITFAVHNVEVQYETRRIRAVWTPEMAQDILQFQNIDAELELLVILANQIAIEIDNNILHNIINFSIKAYYISNTVSILKPKPFVFPNKI